MTNPSTPSAKEQVIAWVRSKNPDTMELKMGCKVKWDGVEYVVCGIGKGMLARMYQLAEADGSGVVEHETEDENGRIECENCAVYVDAPWEKILGSDMGKQEFEIALRTLHGKNNVHVGWHPNFPFGADGFHEGMFVYHIGHKKGSLNLPFDLTKNLHNQPKEFFQAILPLLPTVSA